MDLILTTEHREVATVVTVAGEIDLATAADLRDCLAEAGQDERHDIVLDLSDVTFMDSTGLQVLIGSQRRLQQHGGQLQLVGLRSGVSKILKVTGLEGAFPVHASVEAALAAC